MELNDLFEQFICDRIQVLLRSRAEHVEDRKKKDDEDAIEEILNKFSSEIQEEVYRLMELMVCQGAEEGEFLYVEGLKDGFHIFMALMM